MSYVDVKVFFQSICDEQSWAFAHNYEHLMTDVGKNREWMDKFILTMDEPDGKIHYSNDIFLDRPDYGFWLAKTVPNGDWGLEDDHYQAAKGYLESIILPLIREQMEAEQDDVWRHFTGPIPYRKAGPLTGERLFGIYVSLSTSEVKDA